MSGVYYRVQLGDTLPGIARDYGVPLDEVMRLNGIPHPALLWVGQEVRIPDTCGALPAVPDGLDADPEARPVDVASFSTSMKVSKALELSWESWPGEVAEAARDSFSDPKFLVTLVVIMGIYVGLWLTPDPTMLTKILAGTLSVVLLAQFGWEDVVGLAKAWFKLEEDCSRATSVAQLRKAGDTFAKKVGQVGFDILLFLVMWRVGKSAQPKLSEAGLKRAEIRADAKVAAAEAKPGSGVVQQMKGGSPDLLDAARQQSRGSNPTRILDELSKNLSEAARQGLSYMRTRSGDEKVLKTLDGMSAGQKNLDSALSQAVVPESLRNVAKAELNKARGNRARLQMLRMQALLDPLLRKAMREEASRYFAKLLESIESPPDWSEVREAVQSRDIDGIVGELGESLARSMLAREYPASKGYRIFANVELLRVVEGFTSLLNWQAAERLQGRTGEPGGIYEWGGKVWKSITEIDAVVARKSAFGQWRPVEIEQMKTGRYDRPVQAQDQNARALEAMKKVAEGNPNYRIAERIGKNTLGMDLTGEFDFSALQEVKSWTRGNLGKGFDRSIPFVKEVLAEVAQSIVDQGLPPHPPALAPVSSSIPKDKSSKKGGR